MFQPDAIFEAIQLVFTLETMLWLALGVLVGVGLGAIPGLTSSTGLALMLPLTFTLDTAGALGLLIGLYKGATFGGSISAISFATPGTPDSAATVFDGYALTKKGKGRKAILTSLYSSFTADTLSDVVVILVAPAMALVALSFGPTERFWLMALAIVLLGALSGRHLAKGLLSAAIGLYFGTIGTDPVGNISRNTFEQSWLQDGIHLVPLVIGIFAMSRMIDQAVEMLRTTPQVRGLEETLKANFSDKSDRLTFREYLSMWREMGLGLGIGTFVGMLPGLGATVASFLTYGLAKRLFPEKKIGTGSIYGVAAAESGSSATVGPTLVPLLAFGIPGSATAALIGAALMMQGATPSPRMFELFPEIVYSLFLILMLGNFFNLGIGRVVGFVFARLGQFPSHLLVPVITVMAVIGAYAARNDPYDVLMMLGLGVLGFGMRRFGIPEAPLVITFLIAPLLEENLRRALLINRGDWGDAMFGSALSVGLAGFAALMLVLSLRLNVAGRISNMIGKKSS